jgi:hypothetical protein
MNFNAKGNLWAFYGQRQAFVCYRKKRQELLRSKLDSYVYHLEKQNEKMEDDEDKEYDDEMGVVYYGGRRINRQVIGLKDASMNIKKDFDDSEIENGLEDYGELDLRSLSLDDKF